MPLNRAPLEVDAAPESVQDARKWITDILSGLGRDDLINSAELGVSELVTNAILHAAPPISVAVRGTRAHPRVEVHDKSARPPEFNQAMGEEESLLSTIGRGLGIVALYSQAWGSDVGPQGKVVWFEPSAEADVGKVAASGESFDFAQYVERRATFLDQPLDLKRLRLLNMPVQLFVALRARWAEIQRELRLLSISAGTEYPLAVEISELFPQIELERRQSRGIEQLDQALAVGRASADLEYWVPGSTAQTMTRLLELSEQVDQFCRDERLLVLAATDQQRALLRWYLGEFIRQVGGEDPIPWPGSLVVEPPADAGDRAPHQLPAQP